MINFVDSNSHESKIKHNRAREEGEISKHSPSCSCAKGLLIPARYSRKK
jgi:hypothetical protein